jgi:PEP-CTERM motif
MVTRYLCAALAATIGSVIGAQAAQAAVYDFSYTDEFGVVLAGTIVGVLQADNNTIGVTSIINLEFNGAPGVAVPVITTLGDLWSRPGPTVPEVTVDGTNNNLLACTTSTCFDGFFFDQAGVDGTLGAGVPEFGEGTSYRAEVTDGFERYDATKWSIRPIGTSAVPEPATWAMMLFGFAGLGFAGYRASRRTAGAA